MIVLGINTYNNVSQNKRVDGPDGAVLTFNGTVYHDTLQSSTKSTKYRPPPSKLKSVDICPVVSEENSRDPSLPLVGEHGLTVVRNFEDLTELGKSGSYEFMLNHKGDDKIAIFIGFNRDLTIEIKNEFWNNRFVDFKETIEANVCEETLDVVGFVVALINNTTFVNVAIFNGFVEFGNCGCESLRNRSLQPIKDDSQDV
ncbi:hypothetical protein Tco_0937909 [Tanacetum coccineum]|uniref:Uncharacterized protein n=1 Tax=Tanacetum coccineum TaxID=301880 RepID=A0ABQ5DGC9_9ASTR